MRKGSVVYKTSTAGAVGFMRLTAVNFSSLKIRL